jgi:hypothetical protein
VTVLSDIVLILILAALALEPVALWVTRSQAKPLDKRRR